MKTSFHKIIAGIILVATIAMVVFPSAVLLYPKKAEAQMSCVSGIITKYISKIINGISNVMKVPVADSTVQGTTADTAGSTFGSWVNDCIIKPMVKALVKQLIHQFLSSIVDWINSGFDGSGPRFVSDPASFFADIVDRGVGEMIYGSDLNWLCSPFASDIKLALGLNYWGGGKFRDRISCTLSDVINNTMSAAQRTAYRNSWQSWLDLTTQPQNNPYGAYALAKSELEIRIANKQWVLGKEADWGSGFLTTKRCAQITALTYAGPAGAIGATQWDGDYMYDLENADQIARCDRWETVTPGVTIKEGLSKSLGSSIDQYVAAEDIDAIFGALTNQMIGSIFSATGIFSGTQNRNSYRDKFAQDRAAGIFNVGSGAAAPTDFGNFDCSTISNYSSNPDNINVSYISNATLPVVTNPLPANFLSMPWPASGPKTPPNFTQYQIYSQLTKYCAQQGFWTAAETAADNSIPPLHSSSQNVCSSQSNIYSNDILSTNSGSFDVDLSKGGGSPDLAIDGSTMTHARINAPGWLEITLKRPETLTFVRIQTRDSGDPLNINSVINLYATDISTIPLSTSQTLTTETANYIMTLTTPVSVQKIKVTQGGGARLWISEVALHRYINPIINWAGESSATLNTPFDVFSGVTATKCTDNSALPNRGVTFTVSPPATGTPPSWTISGNSITFQTAGTYTVIYEVNDGTAKSQFTRIIVVD